MRDLEKKFAGTIKDQESELRNLKQRNGEMESKVNTLNRDVSKLTEIVDER
jgi:cell division protein FtsB